MQGRLDTLNQIEEKINKLYENKKEEEVIEEIKKFIMPIIENSNRLIENKLNDKEKKSQECYRKFLYNISNILFERNDVLLQKQATIFTTNYDLFIEKVASEMSEVLIINDGFNRNTSLTKTYKFSSKEYFNTIYNTGNLYRYQVELPIINLIKLHGSLNWQREENTIIQKFDHLLDLNKCNNNEFIENLNLVLPNLNKYENTTLNQVYYDLLRIYANQLDKENTLLIVIGFSLSDKHIKDITMRALKNPTLLLMIICHNNNDLELFKEIFDNYNNVCLIYSDSNKLEFDEFNLTLSEITSNSKNENENH